MNPSYYRQSYYKHLPSVQDRLSSVPHNRGSPALDANVSEVASQLNIKPRKSSEIKKGVEVKKIAAGKAKQVFTHPTKKNVAFYIPFKSSKEIELKNEVQTAKTISSKSIREGHGAPKNIALQYEELPEGKGINNLYTVKTERAKCDGESFIRDEQMDMDGRLNFALDIANGFAELHQLNYVYGDVKPENILVFENQSEKIGKLSDLGKTKELSSETSHLNYSGNPRFMPPEGTLSKQGDVYGLGLMLIRIFEEPFLDQFGDLIPQNVRYREDSKFRGIEKCIINSDKFLGTESGGIESFGARIKAVISEPESKVKQDQKKALIAYIKSLKTKLLNKYENEGVDKLINIISQATQLIPSNRLTAEEIKKALSEVKLEKINPENL